VSVIAARLIIFAQGTSAATASPLVTGATWDRSWFWIPLGLIVAIALFGIWKGKLIADTIDRWLKDSKGRRVGLFVFGSLIAPGVAAFALDVFDLSEVLGNKGGIDDFVAALFVASFGAAAMVFQLALYGHEDRWEKRLHDLSEKCELEERKSNILQTKYEESVYVNDAFREVVDIKSNRLALLLERPDLLTRDHVFEALKPDLQIVALLEAVHGIYHSRLRQVQGSERRKLTLAFFREENGYLVPKYETDGVHRRTNFHEPEWRNWRELLCLTNPRSDCLAVYAVRENRVQYEADCAQADVDEDSVFRYFPGQEPNDLCSIAALPLVSTKPANSRAVICLFTNQTGFFPHWNAEDSLIFDNLKDRFLYETVVRAILEKLSNDNP
jgi:hypothetical protein